MLTPPQESFLQLASQLQIPILTTWKALDILSDDHPLFIGRPGAVGQRYANFAQQNSDLLLMLGARMDTGQTAYMHEHLAKGAKKIMIDIFSGPNPSYSWNRRHKIFAANVRLLTNSYVAGFVVIVGYLLLNC